MDTGDIVDPAGHRRAISQPPVLLFLAILVAILAAWPLIGEPGFLNTRGGGDSPFLLQRLQQLESALRDGHFPVRWMPDANYGYGYPFFNFYAPLSIYIAAVFRFIGFSYVHSIQLAQLAGFGMAAGGMFFLARRWFQNEWAGLLASLAYSAAPFHMVNIYVRGDSLAEFWAMAFYPLVLLAVDGFFDPSFSRNSSKTAVALFALVYAALILSHNISALIFSPFLLLYILLRWLSQHRSKPAYGRLLSVAFGLLLALALAAWFFVPALAERELAQLGPVTEGYFHFSNHFLGTEQRPLLQITPLFNYSVAGLEAFRLGLVQTVTLVAGVVVLLAWKQTEITGSKRLFILLTLILSTFMLLPLSGWLWHNLPLLAFTQFPWRFL
ncbi:MAG: 6-pyruvoyl-tetrahydropterin synthase-related protein, partial [Candidatus Promineifilaceae bacterium]|nr:6-pyruvoyl-tetrahydropterin synthase-related protein [Candidatus Promineifilaceae bacterium]